MKTLSSDEKRIICSNPDSIFKYFGWPSVTRLPDGTLAMAASGFRMKHVCPFGKGILCYSRDEGRTWTAPAVVMDTPLDDRDCGIVPFGKGRVMLTSFNNSVAAQRGWNNTDRECHKWSSDVRRDFSEAYLRVVEETGLESRYLGSTYRISEDGGYTFGAVRISPVTAPHGPCALRDGSLLYVGRTFSSDDSFRHDENMVQCWRLNDKDEFEYVSSIENIVEDGHIMNSCEPHAIELPDGRILAHIRVQLHQDERDWFTTYQSESEDGGKTFTKPRRLLSAMGGAPAHLLLHSSGTLISVYGYRQPPYGIRAMLSRDGGRTWDTDYVLDADGMSGDLGYPATVELPDGRLLTVFYENIGEQSVIMQKIWRLND